MNLNIIYAYLCLLLCVGVPGKNVRIMGGVPASITEFPHMVSFRRLTTNVHFCAGSIISHWNILTAAHCFLRFDNNFGDIRIYSGSSSSLVTSQTSNTIKEIITHTDFTGMLSIDNISPHDIAIVKVDQYIEFNVYQNKINLPLRDIYTGNFGTIVGWGLTSFAGHLSPSLKKIGVTIYSRTVCQSLVPVRIQNFHLCAYYGRGVGSSEGDSGGSLVSDNELVGIISFSFRYLDGTPDILTKVYNYLDFIRMHIQE